MKLLKRLLNIYRGLVSFPANVTALGLKGSPFQLALHHVVVTMNIPHPPLCKDLVPVHIVYRPNISLPWKLKGSGTLLMQHPGYLFTAYHVLEDAPGQYGYRIIGNPALMGQERIIPIVECGVHSDGDDVLLCRADAACEKFPHIYIPRSDSELQKLIGNAASLAGKIYVGEIQLLTSATQKLRGGFETNYKEVPFYLFPLPPQPFAVSSIIHGESGTGALVNGTDDTLFVVSFIGQFGSASGPEVMNSGVVWKQGQWYVGGCMTSTELDD